MKTSLLKNIAVAALAAVALSATSNAATITASQLVGKWTPANTWNNTTETATAANALVVWENGGADANTLGGATFTLGPGFASTLPSPLAYSASDETAPYGSINAAVTPYVVGKYGTVAYLFYLGNSGTWDLAANASVYGQTSGDGLSHWRSFTAPSGLQVPDGGTTIVLLGLGLSVLALARRKLS